MHEQLVLCYYMQDFFPFGETSFWKYRTELTGIFFLLLYKISLVNMKKGRMYVWKVVSQPKYHLKLNLFGKEEYIWKWKCELLSPMWLLDWSQPGSSLHGILQARILEWVDILFSRESSWPRDQTQVSCIAGRFFIIWVTRDIWIIYE